MKKFMLSFIFIYTGLLALDDNMIHLGNNSWIESNMIDEENNLSTVYKRQWKCPYCHHFWNEGQACRNSSCPSRYKTSGFYWSNKN